jgi:hypothetical protein
MPALSDAIGQDLSNYVGVEPISAQSNPTTANGGTVSLLPVGTGFIRCPLPILSQSSDQLRSFYLGNRATQNRIYVAQN